MLVNNIVINSKQELHMQYKLNVVLSVLLLTALKSGQEARIMQIDFSADYRRVNQDVLCKEVTRFCDPIKKKNWCDVTLSIRGRWLLKAFLKPSFKMSSCCCEFECYNRELCV